MTFQLMLGVAQFSKNQQNLIKKFDFKIIFIIIFVLKHLVKVFLHHLGNIKKLKVDNMLIEKFQTEHKVVLKNSPKNVSKNSLKNLNTF